MAKGQSLQDPFLNALRKERIPVSIYLVNGIKLPKTLVWYAKDSLGNVVAPKDKSPVTFTKVSLNTTNKMSVCLRDGEIILRIVAYLLISNDESVLEKSCLKDLKNTYLALGVPIRNARRVIELMRDATISDLNSTVNNMQGNKGFLSELVSETKFQFERIINLLN